MLDVLTHRGAPNALLVARSTWNEHRELSFHDERIMDAALQRMIADYRGPRAFVAQWRDARERPRGIKDLAPTTLDSPQGRLSHPRAGLFIGHLGRNSFRRYLESKNAPVVIQRIYKRLLNLSSQQLSTRHFSSKKALHETDLVLTEAPHVIFSHNLPAESRS